MNHHILETIEWSTDAIEERRGVAGQCAETLQYGIRTYVDEIDDAVNQAYAAWPTRLCLVGMDGRVVYARGLGPFGFKPAQLGAAIETYLTQLGTKASGEVSLAD
jgi:hypothetical protein